MPHLVTSHVARHYRSGGRRPVRRCIIPSYRSESGEQKCLKVELEQQGTIDETERKWRNNGSVD